MPAQPSAPLLTVIEDRFKASILYAGGLSTGTPHYREPIRWTSLHASARFQEVIRESLAWLDKYLGPVDIAAGRWVISKVWLL